MSSEQTDDAMSADVSAVGAGRADAAASVDASCADDGRDRPGTGDRASDEAAIRRSNEAVEIVDGVVETVDVSKHPVESIPESDLSLADIERRRSRPVQWVVFGVAVLAAIIIPYWGGRTLAVERTAAVVRRLSVFDLRGIAFVAWAVALVMFTGLGMMIVESRAWLWRVVFVAGLAAEQFIAGVSLLRNGFWYSTYVVYGASSHLANAANLGIVAAAFGVAVFAVLWVGLLVVVRKNSPLNVLTRSWASFLMFFIVETVALLIVMFGGLLTMV